MCLTTAHTDTALADRLFQSTINTLELYSLYIGTKLGLYRVLRDPVTCIELSLKTGIAVRYSREWLEQQAVAGFIVADGERDAYLRKYHIPEEHIGVLVDDANPSHVAPFAQMLVGIARALPDVLLAYKVGTGVAYEKYGLDFRQGQAGTNRPAFSHDLIARWLPAVPDLQQRLVSGEDVRIPYVGCGVGWSSIALAQAYPNAKVTGIDMDAGSIPEASAHATRERVDVRFLHD